MTKPTSPGMPEDYGMFLAIDWADKKHVWALQKAGSEKRQRGEVEASPEAVEAFVSSLLAQAGGRPIAVAVEQKRGPLMCLLSKHAALVLYPIHPATVSRMRAALYPSSSKNDPKDAELILDILVHHRDRLRRLDADTVETRKLRTLVEDRRKLVDHQTATTHQLRARLKLYFPQAIGWLPRLDSLMAHDFLKRWPTLLELQRAREATVRSFFQEHNSRSRDLIELRIEQIGKAVVATEDSAIVEPGVVMVGMLLEIVAVLRKQIAELDDHIAQTAAVHPELPLMKSLPGAGKVMAPRLIAALGTQRDRFANASELQTYSGIAPVEQKSGQSQWIHFRWACPKFLRQTFHEWAGHSIAQSKWAKAYYDAQIAHNKGHHAAVRALAFKWQRILFRCWKDGQPYDEQKYVESLRRRGSPLAQALG